MVGLCVVTEIVGVIVQSRRRDMSATTAKGAAICRGLIKRMIRFAILLWLWGVSPGLDRESERAGNVIASLMIQQMMLHHYSYDGDDACKMSDIQARRRW